MLIYRYVIDYVVDTSQVHKQPKSTNIMNEVIIGQPLKMDIKSVNVPDRQVQDTIVAAGYGYVNQNIKDSEVLVHKPGTLHMGIWHPNRIISSESTDEAMKSMTTVIDGETYKGRPATIEELASYEAMFHEELKNTVLVALGEKVSDGSREYVACRDVGGSGRELNLLSWTGDWPADCHFLVVFEKISKSE